MIIFKIDFIAGVNEEENFIKQVDESIDKGKLYKIDYELTLSEEIIENNNLIILEGDWPYLALVEKRLIKKYDNIQGFKHSMFSQSTPRYLIVMPIHQEMESEVNQQDEDNSDKE